MILNPIGIEVDISKVLTDLKHSSSSLRILGKR